MKCKSCGTEFTVHTRLPDGVYRCPNPNCTAPYITEKREPSNATLVLLFILIAGVIFIGLFLYSTVSKSSATEATTARPAPATFAYYETITQADIYSSAS